MKRLALLLVLLAFAGAATAQTALDRAILDELNLARQNPKQYAKLLEERLQYYSGREYNEPGEITMITNEGASAVREAIRVLERMQPLPPFEMNNLLYKAARDHVNDIGPKGLVSHSGSDGSNMAQRIERYGNWNGYIGENIDFGSDTARDIVMSLIIDDGVPSRGHRDNIFSNKFKLVGIASGPHDGYRFCCVMDFAGSVSPK